MAMTGQDLIKRRGCMIVLSSPSGAGKTSLSRAMLRLDKNISLSVSITTRPPRTGEVNGVDYYFISVDQYNEMVENHELLEHALVFGNYYGTPKKPVMQALMKGRDILFDIDWQGAQQLSEQAGDDLVKIFILPPTIKDLKERLLTRAQDSIDTVNQRMEKASDEMSHYNEYDWVIVNHEFDQSLSQIMSILTSERLRRRRQEGIADFVNKLRHDASSVSTQKSPKKGMI